MVENPESFFQRVMEQVRPVVGLFNMGLLSKSEPDYDTVLIRADSVAGDGLCNVVVPVDAENEDALARAVDDLRQAAEGRLQIVATLRVQRHYPDAPHQAHSFVTQAEYSLWNDKSLNPGVRNFPASPGANPWG
jgi:hypothetical protein